MLSCANDCFAKTVVKRSLLAHRVHFGRHLASQWLSCPLESEHGDLFRDSPSPRQAEESGLLKDVSF